MPEPENLYTMFREAAARHDKSVVLASRRGDTWRTISHRQLVARVRSLSAGFHSLGIAEGDRIAIVSESRPEWTIVDLATLGVGAALVPIYPTLTADQTAYILRDSGARVVVVSGQACFDKVLGELFDLPEVKFIVSIDDVEAAHAAPHLRLLDLERTGAALEGQDPGLADRLAATIRRDDLATLIYTSGTTGLPKGVILTHGNLLSNIEATFDAFQIFDAADVALSFLPLSHIFERTAVYGYLHAGVSIYFARSVDTVLEDLAAVRPTVMTSVPRLYEKAYARIMTKGTAAGGLSAALFRRLMNAGDRWARAKHHGRSIDPLTAAEHALANILIYKKWRAAFGGRIRYLLSGGAALAPDIAYAFLAAGLEIYEGYGLTETSPVIAFNRPGESRIGTVGRPLGNLDVKLAADGEILVRGPSVTKGYYNLPEDNAASFTEDGYFKTGDIGQIDERGLLAITDRKKDLIKTSGGKYVAPQPIETALKVSSLFSQVVIVGNQRKFCSVLLVPNVEALRAAMSARGLEPVTEDITQDPAAERLCLEEVEQLTSHLASYERPKRVALLPRELTVESGEITPTLKVKRRVVEERYQHLIGKLYVEEGDQPRAVHAKATGAGAGSAGDRVVGKHQG